MTFVVNLRDPVYSVICPICWAFALAPCRTERRCRGPYPKGVTPPGSVLEKPHAARLSLLAQTTPQNRVKGYIPCAYPSCLKSEHTPGGLDDENLCPEHSRKRLKI